VLHAVDSIACRSEGDQWSVDLEVVQKETLTHHDWRCLGEVRAAELGLVIVLAVDLG